MKKVLLICLSLVFIVAPLTAKDKSAKEYIADLKKTNSEETIIAATDWLGKEKEKSAITNLVALLDDKRVDVRIHAVIALGEINDEEAAEALNSTMLNDSNSNVRYAAVLATVKIGSKKSLDAWKKAKETESDPFIKDFLQKMEECR